MYHLHHVCTKGGYDGILIGIDGIDNDWRHRSRKVSPILLDNFHRKVSLYLRTYENRD